MISLHLFLLLFVSFPINAMEVASAQANMPYISAKELAAKIGSNQALLRAQVGFQSKELLYSAQPFLDKFLQEDDIASAHIDWLSLTEQNKQNISNAAETLMHISGSYYPLLKLLNIVSNDHRDISKLIWLNFASTYSCAWQTSIGSDLDNLYFQPGHGVIEYCNNLIPRYIDLENGNILEENIKIPYLYFYSIYRLTKNKDFCDYILLDNGDKVGYMQNGELKKLGIYGKRSLIPRQLRNFNKHSMLYLRNFNKHSMLYPLAKGCNTIMSYNGSVWLPDGTLQYQIPLGDHIVKGKPHSLIELKDFFVANTDKGEDDNLRSIDPKLLIFKKNNNSVDLTTIIEEDYEKIFKIGENKVLLIKAFNTEHKDSHFILDLSEPDIKKIPFILPSYEYQCHPIALKNGLWGMLVYLNSGNELNKVNFQIYSSDNKLIKEFELCTSQDLAAKQYSNEDYQLCVTTQDAKVFVAWKAKKVIKIASYKLAFESDVTLMSKTFQELERMALQNGITQSQSLNIMAMIKQD